MKEPNRIIDEIHEMPAIERLECPRYVLNYSTKVTLTYVVDCYWYTDDQLREIRKFAGKIPFWDLEFWKYEMTQAQTEVYADLLGFKKSFAGYGKVTQTFYV